MSGDSVFNFWCAYLFWRSRFDRACSIRISVYQSQIQLDVQQQSQFLIASISVLVSLEVDASFVVPISELSDHLLVYI